MADVATAIARLETELGATPKTTQPYEHALVAHRLGLAYAESGIGEHEDHLRRALACFAVAADILDPRFHPVEHARVLTAAGSARRSAGEPEAALGLFRTARELTKGRVSADETAAMTNNIGLALLELGELVAAIAHFDEAVAGFHTGTAEGRRGRASALHNRGLARAASGRAADLAAAIVDHEDALAAVGFEEAPLHHGLVQHSRGVAAAALADEARDRVVGERWRRTAIEAFTASLDVFVWPEHAVRHAIASFNLGRTMAAGDTIAELRSALVSFEDAVTAFDPRRQPALWREAYDALAATEAGLAVDFPVWGRTDHLVALLHADQGSAPRLMRRRVARWLALPAPSRAAAFVELARAATSADVEAGATALVLLLSTVMELPVEAHAVVLDALAAFRAGSDERGREEIDWLVDRAVGEAVVGPQRIFVRDHLVAAGFERP